MPVSGVRWGAPPPVNTDLTPGSFQGHFLTCKVESHLFAYQASRKGISRCVEALPTGGVDVGPGYAKGLFADCLVV